MLDRVEDPTDPWFPCSKTGARMARAHVAYLDGDIDVARAEVFATFETDRFAPEVWDAFARLCAESDFDPTEVVAQIARRPSLRGDHRAARLGARRRRPHRGADLGPQPGRPACARARAPVRVEARQRARDGVVGAHARRRHGAYVPVARPRRGRTGRGPRAGTGLRARPRRVRRPPRARRARAGGARTRRRRCRARDRRGVDARARARRLGGGRRGLDAEPVARDHHVTVRAGRAPRGLRGARARPFDGSRRVADDRRGRAAACPSPCSKGSRPRPSTRAKRTSPASSRRSWSSPGRAEPEW